MHLIPRSATNRPVWWILAKNSGENGPLRTGVRRAIMRVIAHLLPAEIAPLITLTETVHDHRRRPVDRPPYASALESVLSQHQARLRRSVAAVHRLVRGLGPTFPPKQANTVSLPKSATGLGLLEQTCGPWLRPRQPLRLGNLGRRHKPRTCGATGSPGTQEYGPIPHVRWRNSGYFGKDCWQSRFAPL